MLTTGNVTPHRRMRTRDQWQPRLAAIEILGDSFSWRFALNDRATCLERALLRLAYGATIVTDAQGFKASTPDALILKPRDGLPLPTRESLADALALARGRRL